MESDQNYSEPEDQSEATVNVENPSTKRWDRERSLELAIDFVGRTGGTNKVGAEAQSAEVVHIAKKFAAYLEGVSE